jgi:acyl-CoA thioesterase
MSPFAEWVGIKIDRLAESYCRLSLLLDDKCKNYTEGIHGGVLATIADTCMGGAVRSLGLQAVTAELTVNYLGKPSVGDELTAEGWIVHRGSTIILTVCIPKIPGMPGFQETLFQRNSQLFGKTAQSSCGP